MFQPRLGDARWQALLAELGLSIPVAARVAVLVRVGGALPLSRPQFVVDGAIPMPTGPPASAPASPWEPSWNSDRKVNGIPRWPETNDRAAS